MLKTGRSRSRIVAASKEAERDVAHATGDKRNPSTGSLSAFDVEGEHRGFEVKHWPSKDLVDAWAQCQLAAKRTGKRGLLVIVDKPGRGGHRQKHIFVIEEMTEWIAQNGRTINDDD